MNITPNQTQQAKNLISTQSSERQIRTGLIAMLSSISRKNLITNLIQVLLTKWSSLFTNVSIIISFWLISLSHTMRHVMMLKNY